MTEPFPIQTMVWEDVRSGRDTLARSKTGSGKTLAFALPIADRLDPDASPLPAALVLVPTRELAQQVTAEFQIVAGATGLSVKAVYGGTNVKEQARGVDDAHVLIATPGRLDDLAIRGLIDLSGVHVLVLDEADRMLDMGFQPQVDRIVRRLPKDRQTMFFSATLDGAVGRIARGLHPRPGAPRGRRLRPADRGGGRPSVHPRAGPRPADQADRGRERRGRAHAGVREHQARGRRAGSPAEGAGRACARAARRHAPGGARPRVEAVRTTAMWACSSRPTSQLAASTSKTSRWS